MDGSQPSKSVEVSYSPKQQIITLNLAHPLISIMTGNSLVFYYKIREFYDGGDPADAFSVYRIPHYKIKIMIN